MNLPLMFLALDVATVVCCGLLGVTALSRARVSRSARWFAAITACNICYVVLARHEYAYWIAPPYRIDVGAWQPVLNLARNLTPGLFMLLSHALFSETRRFPRGLAGLFALQVLLEQPDRWFGLPAEWLGPSHLGAAALQAAFAGAAIYWAVETWRGDLVEARRRLRVATVVLVGVDVIVASLLLRIVIPADIPANYGVQVGLVAFNLVILVSLLLRLLAGGVGEYFEATRATARPNLAPRPIPADDALSAAALERLDALMRVQRIYREPGLSLHDLAQRTSVPEYRLRRLIHEQLGHRNFNRFLHEHRIAEACAQLSDPALRRTPILTIALSTGYQSINTFNRGFGEVMGMTPSAYRAQEVTPKTE